MTKAKTRFKPYNIEQDVILVINYRYQVQPDTFEHAAHYLIEHKLNLSVPHPRYCNDDTGGLAYDPAILLKIILFAYSKGITSSREIEWYCDTNILFKALSYDIVPHFTTLPNFVSNHADEIEGCSSKCCWCAANKACWAMNYSPLMAVKCPRTRPKNGRAPSKT